MSDYDLPPAPAGFAGGAGMGVRGDSPLQRHNPREAHPPSPPSPLPPQSRRERGDGLERRAFLLALASATTAFAQPPAERQPIPDHLTPDAQRAIERGLEYLARSQHADGSWGDRPMYAGNVGVAALCGLALMAGGHHPGRGRYGVHVQRAIEYVLTQEREGTPGFLWKPGGTPHGAMYSHGFGLLLLAEAHGTIVDKALRERVRAAIVRGVQLSLGTQNDGGWRYKPAKELPDISVTICVIMALRSARNAGIDVPKSAVDRTIEYVKACQTPEGGFRYFKQGGPPAFARSAAGLVALYSAGVYDGKEVEQSLNYLKPFKPGTFTARRDGSELHYYYGHYYAAQAMWTAGEPYWSDWFPAIRDELLGTHRPQPNGAWVDPQYGNDYATAMSCIVLQIPNNYLPILQK